jgi:hypothetical protein
MSKQSVDPKNNVGLLQKTVVKKKNEKRFLLFCFRIKTVGLVSSYTAPVKYVVDSRSMIGGYKPY